MRKGGFIDERDAVHMQLTTSFETTVREHLERFLHSSQFDASVRSRNFLRFIVEEVLRGRSENLGQAEIVVAVFGCKGVFDPVLDPIVRVQVGRLRRSLERYYLLTGTTESIRIELPKGRYSPVFVMAATQDSEQNVVVMHVMEAEKVTFDWPIVLFHPFESSADDIEVASRMTETFTMELSRYQDVRFVHPYEAERIDSSQRSSVRFDFRGSLRSAAGDSVIGARLVDRATGEQVWGHEYHTSGKSVRWSSSTDDVARVIVARFGAEYGIIIRALATAYSAGRFEEIGAFSAILLCYHFFLSHQVCDLVPAIHALQDLTSREPGIAVAWTYLFRLYRINYSFELCDLATPIEKAIIYAFRGVDLDPAGPGIRCALAAALLVKDELLSAQEEIEQALRFNANSLAYGEVLGWLMALAGDWERGMALLHATMERNSYCLPHVKQGLWVDHLRRGEFELGYVAALEYTDASPFWCELMIASCFGYLGRLRDARASVAALLQVKPDFPQRGFMLIGYYIKSVDLRQRIVDGLKKAGLVLNQPACG